VSPPQTGPERHSLSVFGATSSRGRLGGGLHTDKTGLTDAGPAAGGAGSVPGEPDGRPGPSKVAIGVTRGAALIAGLTAISRVFGLVRTLVFAQTVGAGCLGTAYTTANQVPNLIYELAVGGALTSAMVPVLARSAARAAAEPAEKERVAQITSALLTWCVVILLPLTVIIIAAAGPIADLLIPTNHNADCARPAMINVTSTMVVIFAPQILLYGISVVLSGLLQAYRKFTGPTLAPVIANVVMISSYFGFAALDHGRSLAATPLAAELVLSIGTTLNIGMLVLVALPQALRLRLRLRPSLRFPVGVTSRVGGLALVGVLEFLAGDIGSVITIDLANGHGDTGALVLVNYAMLVYNSVTGVLALSIVTSTFPVLVTSDDAALNRMCAGSTRALLLMSGLGTAAIAAVAIPAAHILVQQPSQVTQLTEGFIVLAPAVAGQALIANVSRVMFALGRLRVAAVGLIGGQLLGILISVPLVIAAPPRLTVAALSLGVTIGTLAAALFLVWVMRRIRGRSAVEGVGHVTFASIVAGLIAGLTGLLVTLLVPTGGRLADAGTGALAAIAAIVVFGLVAFALDQGDLRMVARGARRFRPGRRRSP
jgi:putative peptidoglycan lipid II flippase